MDIFKMICVLVIGNLYVNCYAQSKKTLSNDETKIQLKVICSDSLNNSLFERNDNIQEVILSMEADQIGGVNLMLNDGQKKWKEFYDLKFEGDSLMFKHNYGGLHVKLPEIQIPILNDKKITGDPIDKVTVYINKNTIKYYFLRKYTMDKKSSSSLGLGSPAKLNMANIIKGLEEEIKKLDIDELKYTIIVLEAKISKTGKLLALQQCYGEKSSVSEIIIKELLNPQNIWTPAYARSSIETAVRIFIKVNPDRSLVIKTPRMLGSFSGI